MQIYSKCNSRDSNTYKKIEGGRIKHFSNQWKEKTSDKEILKNGQWHELEFKLDQLPIQTEIPRQCQFKDKEKEAIK